MTPGHPESAARPYFENGVQAQLPDDFYSSDYYASRKKQLIYFEYILIAGINDAEEQAHLLAHHARRLGARVNLIPYNTVEGLEWSRPPREKQERFLSILRGHQIVATLRREKGHDIDAACGQLRLQTKRSEDGVTIAAVT